jgi:hypothetical protein
VGLFRRSEQNTSPYTSHQEKRKDLKKQWSMKG